MDRNYSKIDRLIASIDEALRISTGEAPAPFRENPAGDIAAAELSEDERRHVAGLMRINHTGEVCAQALYAGQAATAHDDATREAMQLAADEEIDHLSWCEDRLKELDSQPSLLNPFWYAGSFAIGAVAGIAGDEWSLGFVKETENQVEAHLQDHLEAYRKVMPQPGHSRPDERRMRPSMRRWPRKPAPASCRRRFAAQWPSPRTS